MKKKREQTVTLEQQIAQTQWNREHEEPLIVGRTFEPQVKVRQPQLPEKQHELDFDTTVAQILALSDKAQATFFFRLITALNPKMVQTVNKYCYKKLYPHGRHKSDQLRQRKYNSVTDEFEDAA